MRSFFLNFARGLVRRSLLRNRSYVVTQRWIVVCTCDVIVCCVELHYVNVFIIIGCYEVAQGTGLKLIPQNNPIVQFELTRTRTHVQHLVRQIDWM